MTAVDEFYVEQDKMGRVLRQIARVRVFVRALFLLGILSETLYLHRFKDYLTWNWVLMICLGKTKK
jgi:hypothetical protein